MESKVLSKGREKGGAFTFLYCVSSFLLLCICMKKHVHVWAHTPACVYMWLPESAFRAFSVTLHSVLWDNVPRRAQPFHQYGCPANARDLPVSASPMLGLQTPIAEPRVFTNWFQGLNSDPHALSPQPCTHGGMNFHGRYAKVIISYSLYFIEALKMSYRTLW